MKTKFTKTLITSACLTALLVSVAFAAAPNAPKMDTNADGVVDQIEFVTAANARFAKTDANNDGQVTREERQAVKAAMRAKRADAKFEKTDANGDGFLSKDEIQATRDAAKVRRAEMKDKRKDRMQERGDGGKGKRKKPARVNPDTNGDGAIDAAEHSAATDTRFARLDRNGDGVLAADELKAMKRKHRAKKRRGPGR